MRGSWTETTLGEVVEIQKGKKPPSLSEDATTGQPYLTADVLRGSAPSQFVPQSELRSCVQLEGDETVLLWDGAGAGDVFMATTGVLASTMAKLSNISKPSLESRFLHLAVQTKSSEIKTSCRGTTVPHVSPSALAATTLLIPPIPEQRRIVDVIASVDAYIAALQQQVADARTTRSAVLHELLNAGGDDWTETTLGALITLEYGKPLKAEDRDGQGFPVFGSAGEVGLHSKPLIASAPVIIVGRKGTAGSVWWSSKPCSVIDTAFYVTEKVELEARFLFLLLNVLDLPALTAQTGVPGLNRDRAYACAVTMPSLNEQKRIVGIVSTIDSAIRASEHAVAEAKRLRSGLLSDLLSGEHEIPEAYDRLLGAA